MFSNHLDSRRHSCGICFSLKTLHQGAECTQILTAEVGDLVELRIVSIVSKDASSLRTFHTWHIHGNEVFIYNIGKNSKYLASLSNYIL